MKPHYGNEETRSQIMVRTGLKVEGQTFVLHDLARKKYPIAMVALKVAKAWRQRAISIGVPNFDCLRQFFGWLKIH